MINLTSALCSPMEMSFDENFVVGGETSCPDNWSGQYVSPSQPYRVFRVRWPDANEADAAAFRILIKNTQASPQVFYTPPTGPQGPTLSTPRASVTSTVVGRLVGPYRLVQKGYGSYTLEARIEEDH
tara:strand:- start:19106 stop:19486 length:381 start_codon:yes stop_codon:yes gene_type:complete